MPVNSPRRLINVPQIGGIRRLHRPLGRLLQAGRDFAGRAATRHRPLDFNNHIVARIDQLVAWEYPVIDFDELRGLAAEIRQFIQMCDDKAGALRVVVTAHDVVLGIYPSGDGMGLHVIKGEDVLRRIVNTNAVGEYTHTAIAVHNREQAVFLQAALAA